MALFFKEDQKLIFLFFTKKSFHDSQFKIILILLEFPLCSPLLCPSLNSSFFLLLLLIDCPSESLNSMWAGLLCLT